MATIGDRLRQERQRLKLSQDAFGDAAGVGKHSQIRYEKGERSPDGDYLAAIAGMGADVLFIITGRHLPYLVMEPTEDAQPYLAPAQQLAGEIAALTLSTEDADLVLAVARRLCRS